MAHRWLPDKDRLLQTRWLRPLAHRLGDDHLWHLNRKSVARAVSIGLFFGLLLPFAPILFAVAFAIVLRGHVAVAAACTLVTNPLTFPAIYWLAHRLGRRFLEVSAADVAAEASTGVDQVPPLPWFEVAWQWVSSAGAPLMLGLVILSVAAAVVGHVLVLLFWRPRSSKGQPERPGPKDATREPELQRPSPPSTGTPS